jgi:hypothetical protein
MKLNDTPVEVLALPSNTTFVEVVVVLDALLTG